MKFGKNIGTFPLHRKATVKRQARLWDLDVQIGDK